MLGLLNKPPKVVTIRVQRGSGLINQHNDSKRKKQNFKWKVTIKGAKKKISSEAINEPNGNPVWEFEATFKIADVNEPVVIKVKDSEKHHIGQVVIPLVQIQGRSHNLTNQNAQSLLQSSELEPTKKVSNPIGKIFYSILAEEFYTEDEPKMSSRSSILSSSHLHRSNSRMHGSILHRSGTPRDNASVQGSTLSMYSVNDDKSKTPWFKKHTGKRIREAVGGGSRKTPDARSEISSSMSKSMTNLFPSARGETPSQYSRKDSLEHDGSVFGNSSDISTRNLPGKDPNIFARINKSPGLENNANTPRIIPAIPRVASQWRKINHEENLPTTAVKILNQPSNFTLNDVNSSTEKPFLNIPSSSLSSNQNNLKNPAPVIKSPETVASSDLSDSSISLEDNANEMVTINKPNESVKPPETTKEKIVHSQPARQSLPPKLISLSPTNGSTEGNLVVRVYASNLLDSVLQHALVLVDGFTISRDKWHVEERGNSTGFPADATHCLILRLPSMNAGSVFIELETMNDGRLRCPQPFIFETPKHLASTGNHPILIEATENSKASSRQPVDMTSPSKFNRRDSTRNSGLLSDNRQRNSIRRNPVSSSANSGDVVKTGTTAFSEPRSSGFMSDNSTGESAISTSVRNQPHVTSDLNMSLEDAQVKISKLNCELKSLESKLAEKTVDLDRVSTELCKLRCRLLDDDQLRYLEKR